jgi:hypothetical protein
MGSSNIGYVFRLSNLIEANAELKYEANLKTKFDRDSVP